MSVSVQLGDRAKDQVTGFEGICVARTEWLNGCVRVTLQSEKLDKDGKPQDGQTFDEPQLVITKSRKVVVQDTRSSGGPAPTPVRTKNPTR